MPDIQIVAFGTSFTAGKGVGTSEAFPAKLEKLLRTNGEHVRITNRGVNGDTTRNLLARMSSAVPDGVQIVIFEYGLGNDRRGGIAVEDTVKNSDQIIKDLVARNIQVLLVLRGADQNALAKRIDWFRETISRYKISYIEIEQPESSLQRDGQHPTAMAHGMIAESMAVPVTEMIAKAGKAGN